MANYNIDAIYNGNTSLPGTERVRIDSSGNIGIGTATPSTKLHIYENANRVTYISQNDNHIARFEAYGTATAIDTTASNGIFFRISSGDIVKFAADGNVGIGTSTAGAPLHIYRASNPWIRLNGGGSFSYIRFDDGTSNAYLFKNTTSDTTNGALAGAMYTYTDSGKAFQHIHSGTPLFTILSGGNVGIGTTNPTYKLEVAGTLKTTSAITNDGGIYYGGGSNLDINQYNNGYMRFLTNNNEKMRIAADGNVGIGTTSPSTTFHVYGNAEVGDSTADTGLIVRHGSGSSQYGRIRFYSASTNINTIHSFPTAWNSGTLINSSAGAINLTGTNGITFGAWNSVDVAFASGGTNYFKGNVGIGISTPSAILNIRASAPTSTGTVTTGTNLLIDSNTSNYITFRNTADNGTYAGLTFLDNNTGGYIVFRNYTGDVAGGSDSMIYGTYQDHIFQNGSSETINGKTETMRIKGNGNVGIGTTNPTDALYVLKASGDSSATFKAASGGAEINLDATNGYAAVKLYSSGTEKWRIGQINDSNGFQIWQSGTGARIYVNSSGNVGIGTTSPNKKLQVIGSLGKGVSLYEVPIDSLGAAGTQAKRFEIARVFIDYNDWNNTGPIEIEARESYYSDGRYKRYLFSYGYNSSNVGSLWLVEDAGRGANDFKAEAGAAVQVSGDTYYVPIYIDLDYYQFVDVLVRTNRVRTTNASSSSGGVIYINESPTGSNISSFSPDEVAYISLASSKTYLGYSGNVGVGTSPSYKLDVNGITRFQNIIRLKNDAWNLTDADGQSRFYFDYNGRTYFGSANGYEWRSSSDSTLAVLTNGGNVGIGTTSPITKLQVRDGAITAGTTTSTSGTTMLVGQYNDGNLTVFGTEYSSGGPMLGYGVTPSTTSAAAFLSSTGVNVYRSAYVQDGGTHRWYTGAVQTVAIGNAVSISEKMRINIDGNLGIGTSSPANKLHIFTGTVQVSGLQSIAGGPLTFLRSDYNGSAAVQINFLNINPSNGFDSDLGIQLMNTGGSMVDVLRIKGSTGNVGIGTTSPSVKLTVSGDVTDSDVGQFRAVGSTSAAKMINVGYHTTNNYGFISALIAGTGYSALSLQPNGGNVGIGTTSPGCKFAVIGETQISSSSAYTTHLNYNDAGTNFITTANTGYTYFRGSSNNVTTMAVYGGGGVSVGTGSLESGCILTVRASNSARMSVTDGTTRAHFWPTGGAFYISTETNSPMVFITNAGERMRILADGNVGIGTTSPAYKLDVNGSINTSSFMYVSYPYGNAYPFQIVANNFLKADNYYYGMLIRSGDVNYISGKFQINGGSNKRVEISGYEETVGYLPVVIPGGNVGIGTTSPTQLLDVRGNIKLGADNSGNYVYYVTDVERTIIRSTRSDVSQEGLFRSDGWGNFTFNKSIGVGYSLQSGPLTGNIYAAGSIGIGTTSLNRQITIGSSNQDAIQIRRLTTSQGNTSLGTGISWTWTSATTDDETWAAIRVIMPGNGNSIMTFSTTPVSGGGPGLAERMRVDSNGNVGIGTTSPATKLEVYGVVRVSESSSGGILQLTAGASAIDIASTFYGGSRRPITFTMDGEKVRIAADGNVGIGTSSPVNKLHIVNSGNYQVATIQGDSNYTGVGGGQLRIRGNTNVNKTIEVGYNTSTDVGFIQAYVNTGSAQTICLNPDGGNVGIGTTSPITKLHVAGTTSIIPTYDSGSGYSYFLRMGYDTSGFYDYTIKRNGSTGFLEFNGTQGSTYVSYVFAGGDVYSGASGGTIGGFYFNSSSHGIRRATGTNDVYCFTTSGTLYLGAGGSSTTHVRVLSGGDVGIGVSPSYKLDVNGNIHGTGFPTSSDVRFKKNITPLQNSLEKIKKLQGVKYEWNEFVNSRRDGYKLNIPIIGLIAQDVEQVVPEIVDHWKLSEDCQDARSIDYPRLIPLLIEAMKEQQNQIEELRNEIKSLKSN